MISRRRGGRNASSIYRAAPARRILLLLVFLLGQGIFFYSDLFRLHHVAVTGCHRVQPEHVVRDSGLPQGSAVHFTEINLPSIHDNVKRMLWVKQAKLRYRFPSQVDITIQERTPVALVAAHDGRSPEGWPALSWYEVDATGLVLALVDNPAASKLPRLLVDPFDGVGARINAGQVEKMLRWHDALADVGTPAYYYQVDTMGQLAFYVTLVKRPVLIRMGAGDKKLKAQVFRTLCIKVEQDQRPVEYMDLRFTYPALRYMAPPRKPATVGRVP